MAIDTIRVSQKVKEQLIKLKRITGIQYWSEFCRSGLCILLAEPKVPSPTEFSLGSNIEMNWRVYGGNNPGLYLASLK